MSPYSGYRSWLIKLKAYSNQVRVGAVNLATVTWVGVTHTVIYLPFMKHCFDLFDLEDHRSF